MGLIHTKKSVLFFSILVTTFLNVNIAVFGISHFFMGTVIFVPFMLLCIAFLFGVQSIILAFWCYVHVCREEQVVKIYKEEWAYVMDNKKQSTTETLSA